MSAAIEAAPDTATAVRLEGLERSFDGVPAVAGIDLAIREGEFFSLIGPSGCGKTTTLRMIAGLEEPTGGRIVVHGADITGVPAFRRRVNTVFQQYALFPHLSVYENVAFGLRERKLGKREIADRVRGMLALVELEGRDQARPSQLSGGMQQRVALARALVLDPEVLLLDEPLGALDLRLRRQMQLLLKEVQRRVGITFVYVTHDQEEAFSMSDRVGIMNRGRLEQVAPPRDVYERPSTLFVADFVGASNRLPGRVLRATAGGYALDLAGLGEIEAPGAAGMDDGADCVAIVRPEAMTLGPGAPSSLRLAGSIVDVSYLGAQTSVGLATGGGERLVVVSPSHAVGSDLEIGQAATASFAPSAIWTVPA